MEKTIRKYRAIFLKEQEELLELYPGWNYCSEVVCESLDYPYLNGLNGDSVTMEKIQGLVESRIMELCSCSGVLVGGDSNISQLIVFQKLLKKEDKILEIRTYKKADELIYDIHPLVSYEVSYDGNCDFEELTKYLKKEKVKMVVLKLDLFGSIVDFQKYKEVTESVNAMLVVDLSNLSGLVLAGLYPNPFPYADLVLVQMSRSVQGVGGTLFLTNNEVYTNKLDMIDLKSFSNIFLSLLMASFMTLEEVKKKKFIKTQEQVMRNITSLSMTLADEGFTVVCGGVEVPYLTIDVKGLVVLTGVVAKEKLALIGLNCFAFDESITDVSGYLSFGSEALTMRGMKEKQFVIIGKLISKCLKHYDEEEIMMDLKLEVQDLLKRYPLYE